MSGDAWAADIGLFEVDLPAARVYADAVFARMFGVDPQLAARGVPQGTFFANIHPDDVDRVRRDLQQLHAGALGLTLEHRVRSPQNGERWVLTQGRLLRDADDKPLRFIGVTVDVTERRLADARQAFLLQLADRLSTLAEARDIVHESVRLLGTHLHASRVGYGQVQDDLIVVETAYCNGVAPLAGAFPMSYFGAHNVARHRQGLTISIDDLQADPGLRDSAFATGEIRSFASVPLLRGGLFRATLFVSHKLPHPWSRDELRLIEGVAGRIWDALERARAEEELRRLNASLEAEVAQRARESERTWRLAPLLMVEGDAHGILLAVNPAWTRVLGWTPEETLGRDVMEFVAPEDREVGAAGMEQLFQGNAVFEYQNTFVTKSAERRRIAWTTVPDSGHLYGYGRDVTDQLVAEEHLRQAQKMEAVGQLTGGLAHDFNNLLTGVLGSLEMLQTRHQQGRHTEIDRYIGTAQGAARRASALTNRLLAFSRRQALDPKPTNVNSLIGGMEELIRRTVGPSLRIEVVAQPGLWATLVDAHQLENALLNLCLNARDAMPAGGRLEIRTANRTLDAAAAREFGLPTGEYLTLSVTDTGTGMTPDVLRRAFDPFFTTKPIGSGTGLGLSMIYGFVRQSGGEVRISSIVGNGTEVTLYLPRHAGEAGGDASADVMTARRPAGGGETVLVVDDEATIRVLAAEVLGELGYHVIESHDAAAALEVLNSDTRVDLLVTDLGLPGALNGRQLADAGRLRRPGLKVLFITGYEQAAAAGPGEDGTQVLLKPFDLETLAGRIGELMTGGLHN